MLQRGWFCDPSHGKRRQGETEAVRVAFAECKRKPEPEPEARVRRFQQLGVSRYTMSDAFPPPQQVRPPDVIVRSSLRSRGAQRRGRENRVGRSRRS